METLTDQQSRGRALVPLRAGPGASSSRTAIRPLAVFLAQLIAIAQRAPQTRRRRRAPASEASLAYAAVAIPATRAGRALSRSV